MRIFAKRNLGFRNPDSGEIIIVRKFTFEEVPDWIKLDPMFAWAISSGDIRNADPDTDVETEDDSHEAKTGLEGKNKKELEGKNKKELLILATERGIEVNDKMKVDEIKAALLAGAEE